MYVNYLSSIGDNLQTLKISGVFMEFLTDLYYWYVGPRYAPSKFGLMLNGTLLAAVLVWAAIGKVKELLKAGKGDKPYHAAIMIASFPLFGIINGLILLVYTKTIGKGSSTVRLYTTAVLSWLLMTALAAVLVVNNVADESKFWSEVTFETLVRFVLFTVFSMFNVVVSLFYRAWKRYRNKEIGAQYAE